VSACVGGLVVQVDRERRTIRVSLRGKEVMEQLISKEEAHRQRLEGCKWHPEFGSWMIESTPATPYTGYATELLRYAWSHKFALPSRNVVEWKSRCTSRDSGRADKEGASLPFSQGHVCRLTPRASLLLLCSCVTRVEQNMRLRRKRLLTSLNRDEIAPTVTNFPLMGVGTFTDPPSEPGVRRCTHIS
jgi:hypothetical protein